METATPETVESKTWQETVKYWAEKIDFLILKLRF